MKKTVSHAIKIAGTESVLFNKKLWAIEFLDEARKHVTENKIKQSDNNIDGNIILNKKIDFNAIVELNKARRPITAPNSKACTIS